MMMQHLMSIKVPNSLFSDSRVKAIVKISSISLLLQGKFMKRIKFNKKLDGFF